MKQALNNLIDLQKVDTELQHLEEQKGDLPQQVQKLKDELSRLKENFETQNSNLTETKRMKLHWEGELESLLQNLKKHQDQLYSVTTNREYDAITTEIDTIKEKINEAETEIIELMEQEDSLTAEVEDLGTQIETHEESLGGKEKILNEKIKATEASYKDWAGQREQIVAQLRKPILYQYERIRRVKGNTAVVTINKYACSACFSGIPPQKVLEVKEMNQLHLCESCGRILVSYDRREPVTS